MPPKCVLPRFFAEQYTRQWQKGYDPTVAWNADCQWIFRWMTCLTYKNMEQLYILYIIFLSNLELEMYVRHKFQFLHQGITERIDKQDCIPVGCVPPARRPYAPVWSSRGGGGVPGPGEGVPGPGGGCTLVRGVYLVRGGLPGPRGILPGQVPPPCEQNHRHACKNITLPTTSLRAVIISRHCCQNSFVQISECHLLTELQLQSRRMNPNKWQSSY